MFQADNGTTNQPTGNNLFKNLEGHNQEQTAFCDTVAR